MSNELVSVVKMCEDEDGNYLVCWWMLRILVYDQQAKSQLRQQCPLHVRLRKHRLSSRVSIGKDSS